MICVVVKGPTFAEAQEQLSKAVTCADLVELRLDCFESLDLAALKSLRSQFSIPMIFTLRSPEQGGSYTQSEESRLADIHRLLELKPEYLDVESHVPAHSIAEIKTKYPATRLILSYHNFAQTPEDLEAIYQGMRKIPTYHYKIAVTAKNCIDALRLACWAKRSDGNLIAISMGPHGQVTRILGPVIGCPISYAALEENQEAATGQLSAKILIERYHHRSLHPHTALYGLIGNPVDKSISDENHNSFYTASGLDAVYVKMNVAPSELPDFLPLAKQLPFRGLSVTMPLKEHILPLLDRVDPQAHDIGAVNTLVFEEGKIFGYNTDGLGALNAIEGKYPVKGKRVVFIGAGGAAKAIAYEAHRRGALITIVNRDATKALQIAEHLGCVGKGLDYMATCAGQGYDILINCTPSPMPIDPDHILPRAVVMDIVTRPKETTFLQAAQKKGCPIIYGYRMFVEQAIGQFTLWFNNRIDIQGSGNILEKVATEILRKN